jgi:hypothetical protein
MSSFPSRHSIAVAVLADFLPAALQAPYISLLVADRIAGGSHFISDCLCGLCIGRAALSIATKVENANLSLALMVLALHVWRGGAKILGGVLPVLIAPDVAVSRVLVWLALLKIPILFALHKGRKEKEPLPVLMQEMLVVSSILFLAVKADEILRRSHFLDKLAFV